MYYNQCTHATLNIHTICAQNKLTFVLGCCIISATASKNFSNPFPMSCVDFSWIVFVKAWRTCTKRTIKELEYCFLIKKITYFDITLKKTSNKKRFKCQHAPFYYKAQTKSFMLKQSVAIKRVQV